MKKGYLFLALSFSLLCGIAAHHSFSYQRVNADAHQTDMSSVALLSGESFDEENIFYDDFTSDRLDTNWYVSNRKWGGYGNMGVSADNVTLNTSENKVIIRALGNQHIETSPIDDIGGPISGGALVLKESAHPGRFETKMKVANRVGVCTAMWTYTEDNSAKNHEIDIELPPKNDGGKNVFNKVLFTNYIGETNYQQTNSDITTYLNDGEYHTFAFDWYYSSSHKLVKYYVDGQLLATHEQVGQVPYLPSRLWIGCWVPNNPSFVGTPDFDKCYMEIDYVKYSPFKNQEAATNGTAKGPGATSTDYHVSNETIVNNWMSNGEFNAIAKNNQITARGYTVNGTVTLYNGYDSQNSPTSGGAKLSNNTNLFYKVDSTYQGFKFKLSAAYKGSGKITLLFLDLSDAVLTSNTYTLEALSEYGLYQLTFDMPANAAALRVGFSTLEEELYLDNLSLVLTKESIDPVDPPDDSSSSDSSSEEGSTPISTSDSGSSSNSEKDNKNNKNSAELPPIAYIGIGAGATAAIFTVVLVIILKTRKKK